ncbi:MAG: hypothetical protein ACLFUI_04665 [Halanaerobiales bacterium]
MTYQSKTIKVLTVLLLFFSFNVLASSSSLDKQNLLSYFDDMGIINESLFMAEKDLTETEFENWISIIFDYDRDLSGTLFDQDNNLTYNEAAIYLLNAINQDEFVYTYPQDLSDLSKYWEAAKVLELFSELNNQPKPDKIVSGINGLKLIYTSMDRYGYFYNLPIQLEDASIYGLSRNILNQIHNKNLVETEASKLFELGNKALLANTDGSFTGYTVKDLSERAMLDHNRTIRYGHSSFPHMAQLISLLRREGLDARVVVEGRTSSYIHLLKEWGQPSPSVNTTPINDEKCVVHAKEYDLLIEFSSPGEKEVFADVIQSYAQKEYTDQEGLIQDSWFVPLYTSTTPLPGFEKVKEVRGETNGYAIISYALGSVADSLEKELANYSNGVNFEVNDIWINKSFLSYLDISNE